MKIIKILLVIICSAAISSCDNDDENTIPQPGLTAGWNLVKVTGGIAGINDEFPEGEITWTFNADGTVNIFNSNTDTSEIDFFETGDYDFAMVPNTVTPESCDENLVIDNVNFGCVSVDGNVLTLNQQEADGYVVTLHKIILSTN